MGHFLRFYAYITLSYATINTISDLAKCQEFGEILLKDQNRKSIKDKKLSVIRERFIANVVNTATYPFCSIIGYFTSRAFHDNLKRKHDLEMMIKLTN